MSRVLIGQPEGQPPLYVRVGRYGPFIEQGDRRASLHERIPPDELTLAVALEMLDKAAQSDHPLGIDPQTGLPVYLRTGRFGPYVQRGDSHADEKPQNASLLKGMAPDDVTLEVALDLLRLPRTLGPQPGSDQPVVAYNGRFGPYVKCGNETRSLPAELSPLAVTLEQALAMLAQPKTRRSDARREPIKTFDASPLTGKPLQLLVGRYGPYVTDGVTNASLTRGTVPEEVTFEYALNLLKVRAEQGPSKRTFRRRPAKAAAGSRKTAPGKKPGRPKTRRKKAAGRKKSPAKKPG